MVYLNLSATPLGLNFELSCSFDNPRFDPLLMTNRLTPCEGFCSLLRITIWRKSGPKLVCLNNVTPHDRRKLVLFVLF